MTPRPYQKDGVAWGLEKLSKGWRGILIADEMRLGKTPQALWIAEKIPKEHNLICILVPSFLKPQWAEAMQAILKKNRKWSVMLKSYNDIINKDEFRFVTNHKFDLLILDEGHYLKDFKSLRTQAVFGKPGAQYKAIADCATKILSLSGTPIKNRVGELYPWLWKIKHPIIKGLTYDEFLNKWAGVYTINRWTSSHKGIKNASEFRKSFMRNTLRRTLVEVYPDLPKRNWVTIPIICSEETYKQEKELLKELLRRGGYSQNKIDLIQKNPKFLAHVLSTVPSFDKLAEFRKQQGLVKIKPILDFFYTSVLPEQSKFIVYAYHKEVARIYYEKLSQKSKIPIKIITGLDKAEDRNKMVKQADIAKKCILIATMHSIKEGFDLQGFNSAYWTELDWVPGTIEQTQGRLYGPASKMPVFYNFLAFNRGVEQMIAKSLKEKTETIKKAVG